MDMHDIDELERDGVYIYNYYLPIKNKGGGLRDIDMQGRESIEETSTYIRHISICLSFDLSRRRLRIEQE